MPRLSGSRPKQTRLAFTPLPSSSPAAKGYNKQIQDRAAAVSLAGARKRRKVEHDLEWHNDLGNAQIDGVNDSFPIPATSLTTQANKDIRSESGSDSEPVRTTQRHPDAGNTSTSTTRRSSRQQPLDFFSGRDAGSFSPPIKLSSSLKSHSPKRAGMFSSSRTRPVVDVSSDSESLDSPNKLLSRHKTRAPRSQNSRKVKTVSSKPQAITVDSDSDGEGIVVSSPPVSKEPRQQDGPADDDEEVDEDDDMPTTLGTQRRKRLKRPSPDTFIASSPPAFDGGDDDAELVASTRKRRRQHDGDTSAEEHDQPVTPSRRKKGRSKQLSRREREELEEDKAFLEPSSDIEALERQPRSTQSTQKSAKQKALEKLKRKRSGQVTASEDEQEHDMTGDASARANHDDDSDGIELVRQPASSRQMFDEDEYDKDFLDSDAEEENALGVPDGLSLQFTRYASMKASELFIYVVEWSVQKKINPAFDANDEIYQLAQKKLDDEVAGLAGSKFKSAAWTPRFTMALNARPEMSYDTIDRTDPEHAMRDHCDACNRGSHPATYWIQFTGTPYHRETLEEVAADDDDDDDETESDDNDDNDDAEHNGRNSANEPAYDAQGREVPPASLQWFVGKFCMSNASSAHQLQHWRYHLNSWIESWLTKAGLTSAAKIVERDGWSTAKRRKEANKITDRMAREGVVKTLYSDYRSTIESARDSKQGRYR